LFGQKKEEQKKRKGDAAPNNGSTKEEERADVASTEGLKETGMGATAPSEATQNEKRLGSPHEGGAQAVIPDADADPNVGLSEDAGSFTDIVVGMVDSSQVDRRSEANASKDPSAVAPPATTTVRLSGVSAKKAVRQLNYMVGDTLETAGRNIGAFMVDDVFNGDYKAILMGNLRKSRIFKQISDDEELIIDPKRLGEMTVAEALRRQCIDEGIGVGNLKTFHFVTLYAVKDSESRLLLAAEADQKKWSVRQLRKVIASQHVEEKPEGDVGRSIINMIGSPLRVLEDPYLVTVCSDKDRLLRDLSATERRKIRKLIKDGKPRIESWNELLERLDDVLTELDGK